MSDVYSRVDEAREAVLKAVEEISAKDPPVQRRAKIRPLLDVYHNRIVEAVTYSQVRPQDTTQR